MSQKIMRRHVVAGLAAVAAAPEWARAAAADPGLEAAARSDGSLTWYVAQVDAQTAENLGHSFSKSYPGVNVGVIRTTGQVAYQRLLMDIKNHVPQCDVRSEEHTSELQSL